MTETIIRTMRTIALFGGTILIAVALLGILKALNDAGKTDRVGEGRFSIDVPRVTVLQEVSLLLCGVFGATLWVVAATCEGVLILMRIQERTTRGVAIEPKVERMLADVVARLEPEKPPVFKDEGQDDSEAADWLESRQPEPAPAPIARVKFQTKSNGTAIATPGKIKAKCTSCGKTVKGGEDWRGKSAPCPHCQTPILFL